MDGSIPKKKTQADTANWRPQTRAVRAGQLRSNFDETSEALFLTSGYAYASAEEAEATFKGESNHYQYSRFGNPTVTMFENRLAALEGAEACRATSTGMSAVFFSLLALLKSGDRIVAARQLFGSCHYIVADLLPKYGIQSELVDGGDLLAWEKALSKPTQAVLFESPSNPMLDIVDIRAVCDMAHKAGAKVVLDNAFATPMLQRPLEWGADIVVHSATKYIDGQGRTLGGAVLGSKEFILEKLQPIIRNTGPSLSPFNAWVLVKGLETLGLRVERHCANARRVADALAAHPAIGRVLYPGRPDHPQHALAKTQMRGFGGMISVELKGDLEGSRRFLEQCRLFALAESLGAVESLIEHPALMTHGSVPPEVRAGLGIGDTLVRLSVGIEDVEDLIADLDNALGAVSLG